MKLSDPCLVFVCLGRSKVVGGPSFSEHRPIYVTVERFFTVKFGGQLSQLVTYGVEQFFVFSARFRDVAKSFKLANKGVFDRVFFALCEFIMGDV